MIFKGEANTTIMKPDGTPRFKFDDNGLFDTTIHAKEYEQTIIDKLKHAGFEEVVAIAPEVTEILEVPVLEEVTEEYTEEKTEVPVKTTKKK